MGGLRKYLALQAQTRIGLSSGLLIWAALVVVFGTLTAVFIPLIAFIWLAERFNPLIAAAAEWNGLGATRPTSRATSRTNLPAQPNPKGPTSSPHHPFRAQRNRRPLQSLKLRISGGTAP